MVEKTSWHLNALDIIGEQCVQVSKILNGNGFNLNLLSDENEKIVPYLGKMKVAANLLATSQLTDDQLNDIDARLKALNVEYFNYPVLTSILANCADAVLVTV